MVDNEQDSKAEKFLGAVVLTPIIPSLQIIINQFQIIDGQQRLTTLQIILAVFRDFLNKTIKTNENECRDIKIFAEKCEKLTANERNTIEKNLRLKILPTNSDRNIFEEVMYAKSSDSIEEKHPRIHKKYTKNKYEPRPTFVEAYLFFAKKIENIFFDKKSNDNCNSNSFEENMKKIHKVIFEKILLIVITLEEKDDPQIIFETLNARGMSLLPSDLIKNFIFLQCARKKQNIESIYKNYWLDYDERLVEIPFKKEKRFWKVDERQGRSKRTRLDLFMQHYLQYKSGQYVDSGRLYENFRLWWGKKDRDTIEELQEIRRHSDVFANFFIPGDEKRIDLFIKRIKILDTNTIYSILLLLLVNGKERIPNGELDGIIVDLESYLIRRMICGLGTKNYNRFFLSMLKNLRNVKEITRKEIQKLLLDGDGESVRWPNEKDFALAWKEKPVYDIIKTNRCRMVLFAIERYMEEQKKESRILNKNLTIEHVLPQSWENSPDWQIAENERNFIQIKDMSERENRNILLHTFGNLTLLTQKLNSEVSNGSYSAKRKAINEESGLNLNIYFRTKSSNEWNEKDIIERGESLFKTAKIIWTHPKDRKEV